MLIMKQLGGSVLKSITQYQDLMTSRRSQQQEDTNFRLLRMLQANPDLTQREIARQLGISTSGLNYCLKSLIDKGLVKVHNFSKSKNKFGYIYKLTPHGLAAKAHLTSQFLQRKLEEHHALKAEIASLRAEATGQKFLEDDEPFYPAN